MLVYLIKLFGLIFLFQTVIVRAEETPEKAKLSFTFSNAVPAGFEDLAAPQHTLIDVYYGEHRVGEAFATFSFDSFEFDNPQKIMRMIPRLKKQKKIQVTQALTGNLKQHSELLCERPNQPQGCGLLYPEQVGIIFDEGYFKVEIFVHSKLTELILLQNERYLPWINDGSRSNGLINLTGNINGGSEQPFNYNLRSSSLLSHDLIRFRSNNTFSDIQGWRMENFIAEKEGQNWLLSAGMFQSTSMRFLGQQNVLGLRLGSSLKMRTDLDMSYSNQLSVFLPRRTLVKVFRDQRLLFSRIYEQGNQVIDTRGFPEGAYQVDIEIGDKLIGTKNEQRFFSKSTEIPPLDSPNYFSEVGVVLDSTSNSSNSLPRYRQQLFAQLGTVQRLTDTFAVDTSTLFSDDEVFASLGLFSMQDFLNSQLRLGGIISSKGRYGVEMNASGEYENFSTFFDVRQYWDSKTPQNNELNLSPSPFTQADFSANYSKSKFGIGVRAHWQKNLTLGSYTTSYSITSFLNYTLFQNQNFNLKLDSQYTLTEQDNLLVASLRLEFRQPLYKGLNFLGKIEGLYRSDTQKKIDYRSDLNLDWQDEDLFDAEVESKFSFKRQATDMTFHNSNRYQGSYISASNFIERIIPEKTNASQMRYGANFNLSLLGKENNLILGGEYISESAVLIELQGTPKNANFDVLIAAIGKNKYQESVKGHAIVGRTIAINLEPYETYSVRLLANKNTFAQYNTNIKKITLYPGNIQHLLWKIKNIIILITSLTNSDGSLIKNAQVEGALEPTYIDSSGFFQAEVELESSLTVLRENGSRCQVKIPENLEIINGIASVKKLSCFE